MLGSPLRTRRECGPLPDAVTLCIAPQCSTRYPIFECASF